MTSQRLGWNTFVAAQVGFRDQKAVKKVVAVKSNEIVNRLSRTKREEFPDLAARREAYDAEVSDRCWRTKADRPDVGSRLRVQGPTETLMSRLCQRGVAACSVLLSRVCL